MRVSLCKVEPSESHQTSSSLSKILSAHVAGNSCLVINKRWNGTTETGETHVCHNYRFDSFLDPDYAIHFSVVAYVCERET